MLAMSSLEEKVKALSDEEIENINLILTLFDGDLEYEESLFLKFRAYYLRHGKELPTRETFNDLLNKAQEVEVVKKTELLGRKALKKLQSEIIKPPAQEELKKAVELLRKIREAKKLKKPPSRRAEKTAQIAETLLESFYKRVTISLPPAARKDVIRYIENKVIDDTLRKLRRTIQKVNEEEFVEIVEKECPIGLKESILEFINRHGYQKLQIALALATLIPVKLYFDLKSQDES